MQSGAGASRRRRGLATLAVGIGLVASGCVSGGQRRAGAELEAALEDRAGVVAVDVRMWASSAASDNAAVAIRLEAGTSETELADLLADLQAAVDDAGLAGLHGLHVLVGGDGPVDLDRNGQPSDTTTSRVVVTTRSTLDSSDSPLDIDPALAAARFAHSSAAFDEVGMVSVRGRGRVEVTVDPGVDAATDPVGDALALIVSDDRMSRWVDGWTLQHEDAEGVSASVSTDGGLDATVAESWRSMREAYESAPATVHYRGLAFLRSFDEWAVYSTIRLDPVVRPASLTADAWGDELGPFIEAQLAAVHDLGAGTFSFANFYGSTPDEFAHDVVMSTAPFGNFVDRGWNTRFLK